MLNISEQQLAGLSPQKLQNLADRLLANRQVNPEDRIVPRANRPTPIPIAYSQEALLLLDQIGAGNVYNESIALRLEGPWSVAALEESLTKIVERHEILRTRIEVTPDGQGAQVIDPRGAMLFDFVDLSLLTAERQAQQVRERAHQELVRPFDLAKGPLFRVGLLRLSEREHVLCVTAHHIIWDLWSLGVLLKELGTLYAACISGRSAKLPPLESQYADYVLWQREWLQNGVLEKQLPYWRARLAGAPGVLELPADRSRPARPTFQGAQQWFAVPKETSSALNELSSSRGATLYMALLAAFQTLLSRWTGQKDIVVGSPIAGRRRRPTGDMIGLFVNMLAMRSDLSGDPSFLELLSRVKDVVLGAFANQDVPFEKLVADLQPDRDLSRQPLFQTTFALQNQGIGLPNLPGLKMTPMDLDHRTSKFDLSLEFFETKDGLAGRVEYATDLFDATTIERIVSSFKTLLSGIVANPAQPLSTLPLLNDQEKNRLLVDWNKTETEFPASAAVHELFELQAARTPEHEAVRYGEDSFSYDELNRRANRLARHLRNNGVKPGSLVAICLDRSAELIVGLLAILKAGAAYVPLDPAYPRERLLFMLNDTAAPVLLTRGALLPALTDVNVRRICIETERGAIAAESSGNLGLPLNGEAVAYVMYTSGSTGQPKGIEIPHRGINRLVVNCDYLHVNENDRIAQNSNICFDAATFEIWSALLNGATLVGISKDVALSPHEFATQVRRETITSLFLTTALFNRLAYEAPDVFQTVRHVFFGGEAADPQAVRKALAEGRPERLLHVYGPTESTTYATWYEVREVAADRTTVPIGRPISNTTLYVLDEFLAPVPVGVVGELHIGGPGLAHGYLGRPELTAGKFIPDQFSGRPGARLYRTGDLVRYLADGNIEFVGRKDNQVKLRGFRIELGEIEAVLRTHERVQDAIVMMREDNPGHKRLAAYVVLDGGASIGEVRTWARGHLPDYMVPAAWTAMPVFPLNGNGKVERKALPIPDGARVDAEDGYVAPRNDLEERLERIVAAVLRVERVGVTDNFFEIGGDSILAMQIVPRAAQAGLKITLREIFEHQTIAELAETAVVGADTGASQGPVEGPVPLTPIQRWFFDAEPVEPHHFNQSLLFRCRKTLSPDRLRQAIAQLLAHHDALRLRYALTESRWEQYNAGLTDGDAAPFHHIDLSNTPLELHAERITAQAARLQSTFDLCSGPIVQIALFDLGAAEAQRLLIVIHHLAVDGVSWRVLLDDLQTAYHLLERGEPVQLPAKTTSFKTWAEQLQAYAAQNPMKDEVAYWQNLPWDDAGTVPVDHHGGANTVASASEVTACLSSADTRTILLAAPKAFQSHINDILLTALAEAYFSWSGRQTMLINLEGHGREDLLENLDVSRTVGWFTSIFPVLLQKNNLFTLPELLQEVKRRLRAIPYNGMRYGLLRYLGGSGQLTNLPTPQISFNYLGQLDGHLDGPLLEIANEPIGPNRSPLAERRHLIEINGVLIDGRLHFSWTFSEHIHDRLTIEAFARLFTESLQQLASVCAKTSTADACTPLVLRTAENHLGTVEGEVPLTPIQQFCLHSMGDEFDKNILATMWQCSERISIPLLTEALQHVVVHHEALRLGLRLEGSDWKQWNAGPHQLPDGLVLDVVLPTVPDPCGRRETILQDIARQLCTSIDLAKPPLLRAAIVDFGSAIPQELVLAIHHLCIDPVSLSILIQDLESAYRQAKHGVSIRLPAKATSYQKWAEELVRFSRSDPGRKDAAYWLGLPWKQCIPLPKDHPHNSNRIKGAEVAREVTVSLDGSETTRLARAQRIHGMLLDEILLAALGRTITDWTGHPLVAINLMQHGRAAALEGIDVSRTIGWFSTQIPVLLDFTASGGADGALRIVKQHIQGIPNHGIGYGTLRWITRNEEIAALPSPEIRLNHVGQLGRPGQDTLFQGRTDGLGHGNALDCALELRSYIQDGSLHVHWLYDNGLHEEETIRTLAREFLTTLRQFIAAS